MATLVERDRQQESAVEAAEVPVVRTPGARRALLWFSIYNAIAVAVMVAIYQLVYHGTFMDPVFRVTYEYFRKHEVQAVLAASMPFFASLLVGLGYARRAAKRRAREEAVRAQED